MPTPDELIDSIFALGDLPDDPVRAARARLALHAAVDAVPAPGAHPAGGILRRLGRHRWVAAGLALAVAGTPVVAFGWSAPAGTFLHPVRVVREDIGLALSGGDRITIQLSYAEARLADAQAGRDRQASLQEAASILDDVSRELSPGQSPERTRWQADEAELLALTAPPAPPATPTPAPRPSAPPQSSGEVEHESPAPTAGADGGTHEGETSAPAPTAEPTSGGDGVTVGGEGVTTGSDG